MKLTAFVICFCLLESIAVAKPIKPKINQNTQQRIEYGCKRPKGWGNNTIEIEYNGEKRQCIINTRELVLLNTSIQDVSMELKECKENKLFCKVIGGGWLVNKINGEAVIENDKSKLQIDHILPFSYIRLNMSDCRQARRIYNFIGNLSVELADVNHKKSDALCENNDVCEKQKQICKTISLTFNDKKLCEELNKLNVDT